MLDQTSINNFIVENKIVNGMMIFDKGFYNEDLFEKIDKMEGLSYLIPLKQNSAFIKNYGMDNPTEHLRGYTDATILYKKVRIDKDAPWEDVTKLKYIEDLTNTLDV